MIASVILLLFALVPGFPTVTFLVLAVGLGVASQWLKKTNKNHSKGRKQPVVFSSRFTR